MNKSETLRKLLADSTQGEWEAWPGCVCVKGSEVYVAHVEDKDDAALIAALRNAAPELLDAAEAASRAEERAKRAERERDEAREERELYRAGQRRVAAFCSRMIDKEAAAVATLVRYRATLQKIAETGLYAAEDAKAALGSP